MFKLLIRRHFGFKHVTFLHTCNVFPEVCAVKESEQYGVRTAYYRTIYDATLKEPWEDRCWETQNSTWRGIVVKVLMKQQRQRSLKRAELCSHCALQALREQPKDECFVGDGLGGKFTLISFCTFVAYGRSATSSV
eukprot:5246315-Amphidinium_carterae.1